MKVVICTHDQNIDKQGLHLNNPDSWYLRDSLITAHKDSFDTIYCHYDSSGLLYELSSDFLRELFELATARDYTHNIVVRIDHPASPQAFIDNLNQTVKNSTVKGET